jgi:type 1 glutamine amidotransferase
MFDNDGWFHPPSSNLIAWARREKASPIVYIQCGHGPTAYANPGFQRLLANAVDWAVGRDAAAWAAGR